MPAAARHGRLPRVNLPAASPFVNPDSAHHGPRREAGGASIIPPDANSFRRDQGATTAASSLRRAVPLARTEAGGAIGREALDCRHGGERRRDQARRGRRGAPPRAARCRRRAAPLDVPPAAPGPLPVVQSAGTVASGASIKAGERSTAKRETLNAVLCRCGRTDAGAAIGQEALDAGVGMFLSQPPTASTPSMRCPLTATSIELAMTSRDTDTMPSVTVGKPKTCGIAPASLRAAITRSTRGWMPALQGFIVE